MSKVNIIRTVENTRANTTIYAVIVEVVVNAIQAIEAIGTNNGSVRISAGRSAQLSVGECSQVRS